MKKPNLINTSSDLNGEYKKFLGNIEKSWKLKNENLKKFDAERNAIENNDKLSFVFSPDELKIKSLINYIDAPWGSGKTYFIENFLKNISDNKIDISNMEINKKRKNYFLLIDSWTILEKNTLLNFLLTYLRVGEINLNKIDVEKAKKKMEEFKGDEKNLRKIKKLFKNIIAGASINPPFFSLDLEKLFDVNESKEIQKELIKKIKNEIYEAKHKDSLLEDMLFQILAILSDVNVWIIFDNIDRLEKTKRLDIINQVLTWAQLPGFIFTFLTNHEKINIATIPEENFWSKICIYENFKLINDYKEYLNNYEINDKKIIEFKLLKKIIDFSIPIFFEANEQSFDIREIKTFLDNWVSSFDEEIAINNQKEWVKRFISYTLESLEKNDKYFYINKIVTLIVEEKIEDENIYNYFDNDEIQIEKLKYVGLLNNKNLRIQSNFYNLKIEKIEKSNEIEIINSLDVNKNTEIRFKRGFKIENAKDEIAFKEYNNFIDEISFSKFDNVLREIFKKRKIDNIENPLLKYFDKIIEKLNISNLKYFEFKNNDLRKIYIYNLIFNNEYKETNNIINKAFVSDESNNKIFNDENYASQDSPNANLQEIQE